MTLQQVLNLGKTTSALKFSKPLATSVRYFNTTNNKLRYYSESVEKGWPLKYHGKNMIDPLHRTGLKPHDPDAKKMLPKPVFAPKNSFSDRRATMGQNDYIDILGNEKLHATDVVYDIPDWLRVGKPVNEYQMLLLRRKTYGDILKDEYPRLHNKMEKRIKFLYKRLNFKGADYYRK